MESTGFTVEMGRFGSGKTQNATKHLKNANPMKEVNISNYYTGYTNFQLSNHQDIVNVCEDIYNYHLYFNLLKDIKLLHTHKKEEIIGYLSGLFIFLNTFLSLKPYGSIVQNFTLKYYITEQKHFDYLSCWNGFYRLVLELKNAGYFLEFPYQIKFNLILDESSIYFNPRDFDKNFKGDNAKLLEYIYQPRKLNLKFVTIVQSPNELDVKFRRLATTFRMYYKGLLFIRWHKDFYFPDPESMDFEKAEMIGWGINLNFFPLFPRYDYNTKELIKISTSIYKIGSLFPYLNKLAEKRRNLTGYKKRIYEIKAYFNGMSFSKILVAFSVLYIINWVGFYYFHIGFNI